jgi:phage gpG-like protein
VSVEFIAGDMGALTQLVLSQSDRGRTTLRGATMAGALTALSYIKPYPEKNRPSRSSVYGQTWKSVKQRRYFFFALRKGIIQVPYRRGLSPGSQRLGRSWTAKQVDDTSVAIGTNVSYARMVKDEGQQTRYMKAVGWTTIQQDIERGKREVFDTMNTVIRRALMGI